jgi:hypothetical protein
MKTSIYKGLTPTAAFFALCATAMACSGGYGGYRTSSYSSYVSRPYQQAPLNVAPAAPIAPIAQNPISPNLFQNQPTLQSSVTPAAPQARVSVVPTTSDAPADRLQLASPIAIDRTAKSAIEEVPATDATNTSEIKEQFETLKGDKVEDSQIADALKGLVGTWMAVSRQGDGGLSTVELQLDGNGWAKLTVPGADGKTSTTTRKIEIENKELKLTGGDADVTLGKLVEFNSRQMVLERAGGQVTFVRP